MDDLSFDLDADFRVRIAWLYHIEGLTQDAIAQLVGITRARVLRILNECRRDGTVQIRITAELTHCSVAERRLEKLYGLERAIVIPRPQNEEDLRAILGGVTGAYLEEILEDGMTVGLGWGETLSAALPHITPRRLEKMTVVSLLGGLTKVSSINPSEFAWRFADRLRAHCLMIAAPVYAPDAQTSQALMRHRGIAEVFARADRLDLAIVSVGNLAPTSTMRRYELLDRDDWVSLERAGAVGDVLCRFIDAAGGYVDHAVNDRVVAVHPSRLGTARRVVLASGGWKKAGSILAALRLLRPQVLITDYDVADLLISPRDRHPPG